MYREFRLTGKSHTKPISRQWNNIAIAKWRGDLLTSWTRPRVTRILSRN